MSKKKQTPEIPVREDWNPDEWGNIKHPTLSEQEVLSKNWTLSGIVKRRNADPEFRKKHLPRLKKGIKKRNEDPKYFEKLKDAWKQRKQDPEYEKKQKELWDSIKQTESYAKNQERNKKALKERWQDPKFRAKMKEVMSNNEYDEEWRQKQKQGVIQRMNDPERAKEYRKNCSKAQQKKWKEIRNDPELLAKHKKIYAKRSKNKKWLEAVHKANKKKAGDPKFLEAHARGSLKRRKPCAVKEPGQDWKIFDGMSEAAKHYNWPQLKDASKKLFPIDGSTYILQGGRFKGYQTKRIID